MKSVTIAPVILNSTKERRKANVYIYSDRRNNSFCEYDLIEQAIMNGQSLAEINVGESAMARDVTVTIHYFEGVSKTIPFNEFIRNEPRDSTAIVIPAYKTSVQHYLNIRNNILDDLLSDGIGKTIDVRV